MVSLKREFYVDYDGTSPASWIFRGRKKPTDKNVRIVILWNFDFFLTVSNDQYGFFHKPKLLTSNLEKKKSHNILLCHWWLSQMPDFDKMAEVIDNMAFHFL